MFERLFQVIKAAFNNLLGKVEDPAIVLERTYMSLQSQIIQLRQAVAQAVATEEQLERALAKNKDHSPADLRVQAKQQRKLTGELRQRLTELQDELLRAYTKKHLLIARDRAFQGMINHDEVLDSILDEFGEIDRAMQELYKRQELKRERRTRLATQLGFALVWLILNISLLYLLCYYAHLPYLQALFVIPASFFFLSWIWWRENRWFFHRAGLLWQEMSEDLRNLKSSRND